VPDGQENSRLVILFFRFLRWNRDVFFSFLSFMWHLLYK